MKKWSQEEIDFLTEEWQSGVSQPEIASALGRTTSSVMHKIQRLNLTKSRTRSWDHLSLEDIKALVFKFKTACEFDNNPNLPSYKTILNKLGYSSWSEMLNEEGFEPNPKGRYNYFKPALFYLLKCVDTDDTEFIKYGITQTSLFSRYGSYLKNYLVLRSEEMKLLDALNKETIYKDALVPYVPKSANFYSSRHGGFTECGIWFEQLELQL